MPGNAFKIMRFMIVFTVIFFQTHVVNASAVTCYQLPGTFTTQTVFYEFKSSQVIPSGSEIYVLKCESTNFINYTAGTTPFGTNIHSAYFLEKIEEIRSFAIAAVGFQDIAYEFTENGLKYEILSGITDDKNLKQRTGMGCLYGVSIFYKNRTPQIDVCHTDYCENGDFANNGRKCFTNMRVDNCTWKINYNDNYIKAQSKINECLGEASFAFMQAILRHNYMLGQVSQCCGNIDYYGNGLNYPLGEWFVRAKWKKIMDQHLKNPTIEKIDTHNWQRENYLFFSYISELHLTDRMRDKTYPAANVGDHLHFIKDLLEYFAQESVFQNKYYNSWIGIKEGLKNHPVISRGFIGDPVTHIITHANIATIIRKFYSPLEHLSVGEYRKIVSIPFQVSMPIKSNQTDGLPLNYHIGAHIYKMDGDFEYYRSFNGNYYNDRDRPIMLGYVRKSTAGFGFQSLFPFQYGPNKAVLFNGSGPNGFLESYYVAGYGEGDGGLFFGLDEEHRSVSEVVDDYPAVCGDLQVSFEFQPPEESGWKLASLPIIPDSGISNFVFRDFGSIHSPVKGLPGNYYAVADSDVLGVDTDRNPPQKNFPRVEFGNNAFVVYSCPGFLNAEDKRNGPKCEYLDKKGLETPSVIPIKGNRLKTENLKVPLAQGMNLVGNPHVYSIEAFKDIKFAFGSREKFTLSEAVARGFVAFYPYEVEQNGSLAGKVYAQKQKMTLAPGEAFWVDALVSNLDRFGAPALYFDQTKPLGLLGR